ncbi:acetyl-CoA carboxylase biotin carboxyl carrier protein [Actinacidiphila oryziradicis]|uniref:Biotin carboxyl carrier protein of acetyl-CoA carboxylase n=1 Tax=Actinacidiphila oryziradicis TaxID=2571141 RepID=A0A4U0SPU8_9ACTN|nr:acetyl-CoA carboxylase biotin carboxyl carrier protein [Actinacidiphila oryziradicis]TKA11213.1 acetyl-CoA carboxylase biotin carboxyl carrier protein [Actinacidiphila oryziradicis]
MAERTVANGITSAQIVLTDGDDQPLRLLREEVGKLVRDLPGTLTAVTARIGDAQLEVTWAVAGIAAAAPVVDPPGAQPAPVEPAAPQAAPGKAITAPLVGTFYRAPEPGARTFVEVGDRVVAGQPIGIVEAMKLMNHVESEWSGVVTEILVGDATAVEFGQGLVRVEPDET